MTSKTINIIVNAIAACSDLIFDLKIKELKSIKHTTKTIQIVGHVFQVYTITNDLIDIECSETANR